VISRDPPIIEKPPPFRQPSTKHHVSSTAAFISACQVYSSPRSFFSAEFIMATPKFNSKSPTIKRIRKPLLPAFNSTNTHTPSPRSFRTLQLSICRLPSSSSLRCRPLRLALHNPRASQLLVWQGDLPRPNRLTSNLPPAPTVLSLPYTQWTLRSQSRDLS
jgi:hypothetical protein